MADPTTTTRKKKQNIVPCVLWVQQGCSKPNPDKISVDKDELKEIISKAKEKLNEEEILSNESDENDEPSDENDDVASAVKKAKKIATDVRKKHSGKRRHEEEGDDDVIAKYGLEDYDNDDPEADVMHGIGNLAQFATDDDDPYITLKDEVDSDDEDFVIQPTDNLIAVGKVTEEAALLEVYVYNSDMNNLFIHHEYVLPTFPLVLEWLDYDVADGVKGNFVAMGTMEPDIGIWDLDVVDSLEPTFVLEGHKEKKKKKMTKKDTLVSGHSDAVLDLSWNSNARNVLASASADKTVCLWDLSQCKVVSKLKHHSQQVQCISWHPVEAQSLLSGSFDETVAVVDCRSPEDNVKSWSLTGEIERALWNHFSPYNFIASTDKGMLYEIDIRQEKPLFTLSAHDSAITGVGISSQIPGLIVTASEDKLMKVWDIIDNKPSMILSRDLRMDILHCVKCNPDHPFVFAFGGNRDFKVWDIRESAAVRNHFLERMPVSLAAECEGDTDDLPEDIVAAEAMAKLNMLDDEDEKDIEEMMSGDRGKSADAAVANSKKKKKKQKKKKKEET